MGDFERYEVRRGLTLSEIKEIAWNTIKTFSEDKLPLWTRNRYGLITDRIFTIGENGTNEVRCIRSGNLDTHIRVAGPYYDCVYGQGIYIYVNSIQCAFIKITEKFIIYFPNNFGKSVLDDGKYWASSWLVGDTLKEFVDLIINTFKKRELTDATPTTNSEVIWTARDLFLNKGDFTMKIKEVTYSGKATIVFWTDGTKTVVKTAEGETFSKDVGLAMAIAEKYFGSYSAMKSYIKRNTKDANEANAKKKQKKEKKEEQ